MCQISVFEIIPVMLNYHIIPQYFSALNSLILGPRIKSVQVK